MSGGPSASGAGNLDDWLAEAARVLAALGGTGPGPASAEQEPGEEREPRATWPGFGPPDREPHLAEGAAAAGETPLLCRYCPLCQALALMRRSGPDVLDQVAVLLQTAATAWREGASGGTPDDGPAEHGGAAEASGRSAGPPPTLRIDVTE